LKEILRSVLLESIFFIPLLVAFVAFGILPLYFSLTGLHTAISSRNWTSVPAEIISVSFEESKNKDRDTGKSTLTKKVLSEYKYIFRNKEYYNDVIFVSYRKSNSYNFHTSIYRKLSQGGRVAIWVNPKRPAKSVIIQGYVKKGGHIMILLFGCVGAFGTLLALSSFYPIINQLFIVTSYLLVFLFISGIIYWLLNIFEPEAHQQINLIW